MVTERCHKERWLVCAIFWFPVGKNRLVCGWDAGLLTFLSGSLFCAPYSIVAWLNDTCVWLCGMK